MTTIATPTTVVTTPTTVITTPSSAVTTSPDIETTPTDTVSTPTPTSFISTVHPVLSTEAQTIIGNPTTPASPAMLSSISVVSFAAIQHGDSSPLTQVQMYHVVLCALRAHQQPQPTPFSVNSIDLGCLVSINVQPSNSAYGFSVI